MKLKNPTQVRRLFAERRGWLTIREIAIGTESGVNTVQRGLRGEAVRPKTIQSWAKALEVKPLEIADFANGV